MIIIQRWSLANRYHIITNFLSIFTTFSTASARINTNSLDIQIISSYVRTNTKRISVNKSSD